MTSSSSRLALASFLLLGVVLCSGCRAEPPRLEIRVLTPQGHPEQTAVAVVGVPAYYLPASRDVSPDVWPTILRIAVVPDGNESAAALLPPVAGSYRITGSAIVFTPAVGFEPGVKYRAVFDGSKLPAAVDVWKPEPVVAEVFLATHEREPSTTVARIYPSAEVVPENQLRLHIEFSAPMGRREGNAYIHLLDEQGSEVRRPFQPLDADFWNRDRTIYTVLFAQGQRPLASGRVYTVLVDREWKDGHGLPLREAFRRTFRVGPADRHPLDPTMWRMTKPAAGSRDALVVTFPEALDYGFLQRALEVNTVNGRFLPGDTAILSQETRWAFTPAQPWKVGGYELVARRVLEDLAGNRIGRAFDAGQLQQVAPAGGTESIKLSFLVD